MRAQIPGCLTAFSRPALRFGLCLWLATAGQASADEVTVPGGSAAILRLLRLEPDRPAGELFLEVHRTLFAHGEGSWEKVEPRRFLVDFASNVARWRREFGDPAVFSQENGKRTRQAFEWLGYRVDGEGSALEIEPRDGADARSRQEFLPALGLSADELRSRLAAGETVSINAADAKVPLPFGLAAWRETLDIREKGLTAENAFLLFTKNVKASRMLVALSALDPGTRDGIRSLGGPKGPSGWRLLFDDAFEGFTRHPEALVLRNRRFVLPGGPAADPVWAEIVGVAPSDPLRFLTAVYRADGGKASYVIASLRSLPDDKARALVLGPRFRRLYRSIESAGSNFERTFRDPYDFAHLVRFLRFSPTGDLLLAGGAAIWRAALDGSGFPQSEEDLTALLEDASRHPPEPEEILSRLFSREVAGSTASVPAQKRFLIVSSLVESRPAIRDPGVIVLLFRGLERFLPAYAPLEDLPLDSPRIARRYLFTLDRLDAASSRAGGQVRVGLFEASVQLLADLSRSGVLGDAEARGLFEKLLDLPVFAEESPGVSAAVVPFDDWLEDGLAAALRSEERSFLAARSEEQYRREGIYRDALASRNDRVLGAWRRTHTPRAETAERLRELLSPVCPPDDGVFGPFLPRYVLERQWLAGSPDGNGEAAERAGELVAIALNEAIATERQRARFTGDEPARIDGEVPGTFAYADRAEPLPDFDPMAAAFPQPTPDDLVSAALAGRREPATFRWRGGRYRFDPVADEIARRKRFCDRQRLGTLEGAWAARARRKSLLAAASRGDLPTVRNEAAALAVALGLDGVPSAEPRVARAEKAALATLEKIQQIQRPRALERIPEHLEALDAVLGERLLEALLGHLYAAAAGDPNGLYYQDPDFVRRHSFREPFGPTALRPDPAGQGSTIGGALSGLPDVLGLLHAEQLVYRPGTWISNDTIKMGVIGPVQRVSVALLDDDALRFVALSCAATEELAGSLGARPESERNEAWEAVARDLLPPYRLHPLASLPGGPRAADEMKELLTPSDLYQIGRRLAWGRTPAGLDSPPSAAAASEVWRSLVARWGEAGAHGRLAEFGPRPATYAGRVGLADLDLPPYEELAAYRLPLLLADRLFDLKIVAARRAVEAGLPAALLSVLLPPALDDLLERTAMWFAYDWATLVRQARALSQDDVERYLDAALRDGRITRDDMTPGEGSGR